MYIDLLYQQKQMLMYGSAIDKKKLYVNVKF